MAELEIPERAYESAGEAYVKMHETADHIVTVVDAAAPIIVAAELRRLFERFSTESRQPMDARALVAYTVTMLLSRADELDPEGNTP